MTLVVGVNLGQYVLFGADSRFTSLSEDLHDHDEMKKIIETPTGLASATGLTNVTSGVIEEIITKEITDPDDLAGYLRDFRTGWLTTAPTNPAYKDADPALMNLGAWLLSSIERGALQVRVYASGDDFEPREYPEGLPCSLLPIDMTPGQSAPNEYALKGELRICRQPRDIDASLERNMATVARYFKRQSQISTVLGTGIQFGFHSRNGHTEVMEIIPLSDF